MGARPIVKTHHGHELGDVVSALQKSVRRGLVDDAVYWGIEMELTEPSYVDYAWSRLLVMASEDIGLASTETVLLVHSLYGVWQHLRKKKNRTGPERLMFVHAIVALATAPKSRVIDTSLNYLYRDHEQQYRPVPDYALDGHTRRGRMKLNNDRAAGATLFYDESTKVFPFPGELHGLLQSVFTGKDPYATKAEEVTVEGKDLPPVPGARTE